MGLERVSERQTCFAGGERCLARSAQKPVLLVKPLSAAECGQGVQLIRRTRRTTVTVAFSDWIFHRTLHHVLYALEPVIAIKRFSNSVEQETCMHLY